MRFATIVFALSCAALAVTAPAYAKGASQATIAGPGLERDGIVLASDRGANPMPGSALARFARAAGFIKPLLGEIGVPASPPARSPASGYEISWAAAGLVALVVGSLGAALAVLFRRRPGTLATR